MTGDQPSQLIRLLDAPDQESRDAAWDEFVRTFSRLLMSITRQFGGHHDGAMDRYAHILEQLRCDDFRRLRRYAADGRGQFTTWLVVVARRLCLDYQRRRYGRTRGGPDRGPTVERVARRRLVDFIAEDLDRSGSLATGAPDPEMELRSVQVREALHDALRRLPARDRLLLAFRYEEQLPAARIAQVMSLPSVFHVYRRLTAIQRSLRALLERQGVDGAAP